MGSDINSWIMFIFFSWNHSDSDLFLKKQNKTKNYFLVCEVHFWAVLILNGKPIFLSLIVIQLCNWLGITTCFSHSRCLGNIQCKLSDFRRKIGKQEHNTQSIFPSAMQDVARSAWFSLIYCQGTKREHDSSA